MAFRRPTRFGNRKTVTGLFAHVTAQNVTRIPAGTNYVMFAALSAAVLWQPASTAAGTPLSLQSGSTTVLREPYVVGTKHVATSQWLNPDTSRGTPKTLLADNHLPFEPNPQFAQIATPGALNPDTSKGTPKTLTADKQLPVRDDAWRVPMVYPPSVTDTSKSTSLGLLTFVAPPFVPAAWVSPGAWPSQVVDTGKGSPVGLLTVVIPPFVPAPWVAPGTWPRWIPADTSGRSPLLIRELVAPTVAATWVVPPKNQWQPANTSQSTSPELFPPAAAQTVFFREPYYGSAPQRMWFQPADTTAGTPKPLYQDDTYSVPNAWELQSIFWAPPPTVDTSRGMPIELRAVVVTPPTIPTVYALIDRPRELADTTHGTPKTLTVEIQVPTKSPNYLLTDRRRDTWDTGHGSPLALISSIPPPPVVVPIFLTSMRQLFLPAVTAKGTNPVLLPPPNPPPPPVPLPGSGGLGGGGWPDEDGPTIDTGFSEAIRQTWVKHPKFAEKKEEFKLPTKKKVVVPVDNPMERAERIARTFQMLAKIEWAKREQQRKLDDEVAIMLITMDL